ncbi:hypothetical protein IV203_025760 [Nitzschia inconspicua]|uniref:Helitron helicase-like domain-containing protein n=1 Tax=Nitzschia inconspicua TaxID=303405 RepID=A0A9K3LI42_9STRA|nr:hypothetical protein IV203_025760 [Nitzschia inconspicua]
MANGDAGSDVPPSPMSDEEVLRKYISESQTTRLENPGFCSVDFENVIAIVVEHILGWDCKEHANKPSYGFFGDLDGWTYAVEEQGRKTLHAHFLLWVKGWNKLSQNLGTVKDCQRYEMQLCKYADNIMCTHLHGSSAKFIPNVCEEGCSNTSVGIEKYQKCTAQDFRELRTKHGETSFGKKNLVQCPSCHGTASSEDLIVQHLKRFLGNVSTDQNDRLFSMSHYVSKCRLLMEMKLVHEMLPPRRTLSAKDIERMRYTPSSEIKFIVTALRNVHSSEHRKSCFKKGCECQMKIPSPDTTKTLVLFDDVQTKWYDWRGNDISRALSICAPKRAHVDAFVNVNNSFVSTLFGCNTNVATGLDGGSVMYCTCYISKNTEKEDSEHFASAAKHMVKRMEQRMMERMVIDSEEQEEEDSSIGLKSMIGAALMATKQHKVAAPMASYLIRNGSRFHYSHFFAYVNIGSFFKDVHEDFNISADGDGKVFLKSSVANYIYRPKELEGVCVYDFLAKYSACKPTKNSFNWAQVHPNKDHLKISQLTTERIPVINYLNFVDTRNFNGNDIFSCNIEEISVEERSHGRICKELLCVICAIP